MKDCNCDPASEMADVIDRLEGRIAQLEGSLAETLNLPYEERKNVIDKALATPSAAYEVHKHDWKVIEEKDAHWARHLYCPICHARSQILPDAASEVLRAAIDAHNGNWSKTEDFQKLIEAVRKYEESK